MIPDEPCPLCLNKIIRGISGNPAVFRKCSACGAVINTSHRALEYGHDYFNDEYLRQYGRTYVDDFENIYRISGKRLERISNLLGGAPKENLRLLDIGSAHGFFLKAARDSGFGDVSGVEISAEASTYCREHFGIPVIHGGFDEISFEKKYDVITAWYFIEHLRDTRGALDKIALMLAPGGIFAFSAPSVFGPLYVFHRNEWCASHPVDHRIDLSPGSVRFALKGLGFSKIRTFAGGVHPERMVPEKSPLFGVFKYFYGFLSGRLSFSDTLEVYAEKK